jgi:hypothetical protein
MPEVEELVKIQFFCHKTSKSVTHLHDFTPIWIHNVGNGGNGVEIHAMGMFLELNLLQSYMTALTLTPTILVI